MVSLCVGRFNKWDEFSKHINRISRVIQRIFSGAKKKKINSSQLATNDNINNSQIIRVGGGMFGGVWPLSIITTEVGVVCVIV